MITPENDTILNSIPHHRRFPQNTLGKDYFVGDIHGQYLWLKRALKEVKFNPSIDRLFSTGDLIDRGHDSLSTIKLTDEKWFHPIIGNHEQLLLNCKNSQWLKLSKWFPNGGQWWESISHNEKKSVVEKIRKNYTLSKTVETNIGDIGLIHADFPPGISWPEFTLSQNINENIVNLCIWSRSRVTSLISNKVEGVTLLILGHTPVNQPIYLGNCLFIDTGSGHLPSSQIPNPKLTLVSIHNRTVNMIHISDKGVTTSSSIEILLDGQ